MVTQCIKKKKGKMRVLALYTYSQNARWLETTCFFTSA